MTLDKYCGQDLYQGASEHVKEEQIEAETEFSILVFSLLHDNSECPKVLSKDKELVVILHGVPTMKAVRGIVS